MPGVLTLFFKDEKNEAGEAVDSRSLPVLGTFVEGGALIAGVSDTVTAIFPLAELKSAVYVEPAIEGEADGSDAEAAEEGSADDSGGKVYIPNFGKASSEDAAGSDGDS